MSTTVVTRASLRADEQVALGVIVLTTTLALLDLRERLPWWVEVVPWVATGCVVALLVLSLAARLELRIEGKAVRLWPLPRRAWSWTSLDGVVPRGSGGLEIRADGRRIILTRLSSDATTVQASLAGFLS